ncbi:MAG: thioredoxin, partial [Thermoleophilia bacterium]|nr:thioredoxin [Thermoleophilia bacterium]
MNDPTTIEAAGAAAADGRAPVVPSTAYPAGPPGVTSPDDGASGIAPDGTAPTGASAAPSSDPGVADSGPDSTPDATT